MANSYYYLLTVSELGACPFLRKVLVGIAGLWVTVFLLNTASCRRHEFSGTSASAPGSTAQETVEASSLGMAPEIVADVSSLPVVERCDIECRRTRKTSEFTLTSALLRAVLTRRGSKNASFSPVALVSPNDEWMIPAMPLALSFAVEQSHARFIGVDGVPFRHAILYIDRKVPYGRIGSSAGPFEVFQPPLRDSDNVLSIVFPPKVAVERIANSIDSTFLHRLLETPASFEESRAFVRPAPWLNFTITKLLKELKPVDIANVKQECPVNVPFELGGGGALTGFLRIRSRNATGRPTWFFLQNAEGELLVVAVINSSPNTRK